MRRSHLICPVLQSWALITTSTSFHAMEEIYVNTEHLKCVNPTHSTNHTGKKEVAQIGEENAKKKREKKDNRCFNISTVLHFVGSLFYFIYLFIFPVFSGQRSFYLVIILCLSLLSVFLLAGLVSLGFFCKLCWLLISVLMITSFSFSFLDSP